MAFLHITTLLLRHERLSGMPGKPAWGSFQRPLFVGCGGIDVDLATLEAWKTHFER